MSRRPISGRFRAMFWFMAIAMLSGCGGDDPTAPRNDAAPNFENIWPAAVGNHWTYELSTSSSSVAETLYATAAEVPAVPPMEQLYEALRAPVGAAPVLDGSGTFQLRFVEDVSPNVDTVAMLLSKETLAASGEPAVPMALSKGSIWMRFATQIRYYGSGNIDWVHLIESLDPGYEFTVPVPFLGRDASLTTKVWRTRSYSALGITYPNCIECFYVLDFGVVPYGTAYEIDGYFRPFAYGVIVYAPELGPVYCHERMMYGTSVWNDRTASLSDFVRDTAPARVRGQ